MTGKGIKNDQEYYKKGTSSGVLFLFCAKFNPMETDTWIIEYRSPNLEAPLFLIWYTDTDNNRTDKFLTYKTGEIFSASSLAAIKAGIATNFEDLKEYDNLIPWLNEQDDSETTLYDMEFAYQGILAEDFSIPVVEGIAKFVNLFGDYVHQDEANIQLRRFMEDRYVKEVWEYYYDVIFWPRFTEGNRFDLWDELPALEIDTIKLVEGIELLMKTFEDNIRL